ncbi:MAG: hypothetical protein ACLFV5_03985 [Anaerolineales bacterium]
MALFPEVDENYRKAKADGPKRIISKGFNPQGGAWLPILHTPRREREFTALYSNTTCGHESNKPDDWAVLYFARDGGQATVVTETHAPWPEVQAHGARTRGYMSYKEKTADKSQEAKE